MRLPPRRTRSFTLIELIVCIVILGILGAPALPGAAASPRAAGAVPAGPGSADPAAADLVVIEPEVELPRSVRGRAAIRLLGDQLPDAAALNDMRPADLRQVLRTDSSAVLAPTGQMYYEEPVLAKPRAAASAAAAPSYPLDQTLELHSNPGSTHTIFLDFDGGDLTDSAWMLVHQNLEPIHPAWDPSGNGPAFDDAERRVIQSIWSTTAEDFAAFDVDVTTQDPGADAIRRDSESDQSFGSRVLFTPDESTWPAVCPSGCGGIAWVGGFGDWTGSASGAGDDYGRGSDRTALVRPPATALPELSISLGAYGRVASHEVGHQLGLTHDGNASVEYYPGHGPVWMPIMGSGGRPLSQWSRGDYVGANQHQDDVAIMAGVLGSRADEAGDSPVAAPPVPVGTAYVSDRRDVDVYALGTCTGPITLAAETLEFHADLDLSVTLLDASGSSVALAAPPVTGSTYENIAGLDATLDHTVATGTYYVAVDGVGHDTWATQGYDDYGSLGAYTLGVVGACDGQAPTGVPSEPVGFTATPDPVVGTVDLAWSAPADSGLAPVTGYVVRRAGELLSTRLAADTTSLTVTGLELSTTYEFQVTALSSRGPGATSPVSVRTADPVAPSAPRNLTVAWDPFLRASRASWAAPVNDGGAPVIRYDILLGGVTHEQEVTDRSIAFSGTRNSVVTIEVRAVNRAGSSPPVVTTYRLPSPPHNDHYVLRTSLPGASGSIDADNTFATRELYDPTPPSTKPWAQRASLWFSWTAPTHGPATFTTSSADPTRDTTLGVYTGGDQASLTLVAGNDDRGVGDPLSEVTFAAVAGTTYTIAVDGILDIPAGTGPFTLSWQAAPAAATTTSLAATTTGRSVTLTATVSADIGTPAGTVAFTEGGTPAGSAGVIDGVAELTLTDVASGAHEYAAAYQPGSAAHSGSASDPASVTVAAVATTTTLRVTRADRSVALEVEVSAVAGTPSGLVELVEAGEVLTSVRLVDGSATATLTGVSTGPHAYLARFVADDRVRFADSTSSPQAIEIGAPTTTTVSATVSARTVTLAVNVASAAGSPSGTVRVSDGGTEVGTATVVDGVATLQLAGVASGTHAYVARFTPTSTHLSSSSEPFAATVAAGSTTTTLSGSADGRAVTLSVTVDTDLATAIGTVEILDGDTVVRTLTLFAGTATTTIEGVRPGGHDYRARFVPADGALHLASVSVPHPIAVEVIASRTDLSGSVTGRTVTLTATVTTTEGEPAGVVVFRTGLEVVATEPITAGTASAELDRVTPGDHPYTATFVPADATSYAGSVSDQQNLTVARVATTTVLRAGVDERTVTLSVAVSSDTGTPLGAVEVEYDGGYRLDPVPLVDGVATFTVSHVWPGEHTYTARYVPDGGFHAASEDTRTVTVAAALRTVTTLATEHPEDRVVRFIATVAASEGSPSSGDGRVVIHDDGVYVTEFLVYDGAGWWEEYGVVRGVHRYTATFTPAPGSDFRSSVSGGSTIEVRGIATTTTLTATPGEGSVALEATVSGTVGYPSGTLEIYRGDALLASEFYAGGILQIPDADLVGGPYTYRAVFVAGPIFEGSTADAVATVAPTTTTTALSVRVVHHRVTLTADVSATRGSPTGTVAFHDGDTVVATAEVDAGSVSATLNDVPTGAHAYTATFVPAEASRYASSTSAPSSVTVAASPTTIALTAIPDGTTVRVQVAVTSEDGTPAGTVEIVEGDTVLTSVTIDGRGTGRVTLPDVSIDAHTYLARYVPVDGYHQASVVTATVQVTGAPHLEPTTTVLATAVVRRAVTLSATVSGGISGRVEFFEDGVKVGEVPASGGTATYERRAAGAGERVYTATFVPTDASAYATSSSTEQRVTVAASVTTTTLTGAVSGSSVTLDVTVAAPDQIVPSGTVRLVDGATSLGTAVLVGGRASFALPGVAVGRHDYRATFDPSSRDEAGSISPALALTVVAPPVVQPPVPPPAAVPAAASRTTLTVPPKAKAGSRPAIKVSVVRGNAAAAGTVVVKYGSKQVTLKLKGGKATFKLPKVKAGKIKLKVTYSGNATTKASGAKGTIKVKK